MMQILSNAEAARLLSQTRLAAFFSDVDWPNPDPVPPCFLPKDAGAKVGLARVIGDIFLDGGPSLLWITEHGIWSSSEHMDLFTRDRLSLGEARTMAEAPLLLFDSDDRNSFISMISMGPCLSWGFEIMGMDRSLAMTVSHDEWISIAAPKGTKTWFLISKYFAPVVVQH
jgi:hypothetical protein